MYTVYVNNTLPPALAVHEIYRDIFGPPMVYKVSFDNKLARSLLTTCNRLVVNEMLQVMRTHPDIGLLSH